LQSAELDQAKQLRDRIGLTKLARLLDISFYTCRSMLEVEGVTERTLRHVRERLPNVAARYLKPSGVRRGTSPNQDLVRDVGAEVRATLAILAPYVSMSRLARMLDVSLKTLKAAAAGYRPMHFATAEALRSHLDELLQPPYAALRNALRAQPQDVVLRGLQVGVVAPLPGMNAAETRALLLGDGSMATDSDPRF
jgi:hypothetical protein